MTQLPLYKQVARVLQHGLSDAPADTIAAVLPENDENWMRLFAMASVHKVLSGLSYAAVACPNFTAALADEEYSALASWHQGFAERTKLIKAQMSELEQACTANGTPVMLIKGSARFYDDLYPDISVRHMADLDLLVQDHKPFHDMVEAGYDIHNHNPLFGLDGSDERLAKVLSDKTMHHLPPISRLGDQVTIEFHVSPFDKRLSKLSIPSLWPDAAPVFEGSFFYMPSHAHQLIICIIHALYHGKGKNDLTIKIRDLYEGRNMFLRLSSEEVALVEDHFKACGYGRDYALWKFLCFDLFEDPELAIKPTRGQSRYVRKLYDYAVDPKWRRLRKFRGQFVHFVTFSAFRPQVIMRKLRLTAHRRKLKKGSK